MNTKTLAETVLRIWAIILIVTVTLSIPNIVSQFFGSPDDTGEARSWRVVAIWNSMYAVLSIIAGIAVFKFSGKIANRISTDNTSAGQLDAASIEAVAFGALGAYFGVLALRDCATIGFQLLTKPKFEDESLSYLWSTQPEALVGATVQLIAGIALFLGRSGLARLWAKFRGNMRFEEPNGSDDSA